MVGSEAPGLMQEAILTLCGQLKDDAVALVDAIAPPDFVLNSPIGHSDGQVLVNNTVHLINIFKNRNCLFDTSTNQHFLQK